MVCEYLPSGSNNMIYHVLKEDYSHDRRNPYNYTDRDFLPWQ